MVVLFLQIFCYLLFCHGNISTKRTTPYWFMWLSMWKRHLKHSIVICVGNISRKKQEKQRICKKKHNIFVNDIKISNTFFTVGNLITWKSGTAWTIRQPPDWNQAGCLIKIMQLPDGSSSHQSKVRQLPGWYRASAWSIKSLVCEKSTSLNFLKWVSCISHTKM